MHGKVLRFLLSGGWKKDIWGEGSICDNVNDAIKQFCPTCGILKSNILRYRLLREYLQRQVTPLEYFLFGFPSINEEEKDSYLSDQWKDRLSMKATNLNIFRRDIQDKFEFYLHNKQWFNREMMKLTEDSSFDEFQVFTCKESSVFIKPINGSYGRGAFVYNYNENDIQSIYNQLVINGGVRD